jgi:hypothetical protein
MDIDKKIEEIINFQVEQEEVSVKEKKQRKILRVTEQNVKTLVMDRICGRMGEC